MLVAAQDARPPLTIFAAQLLGLATSQRAASGVRVPPIQRPAVERAITAARAALGNAAYEAAFVAGRELPLDGVAERALDLVHSATTEASPDVAHQPGTQTTAASWSPLTVREREVAELVAGGMTNRQIAARLVISSRTVQTHVASILGKLDFMTRSQIAAWVARRGLPAPPAD
jgi:non-specific serine/threonine protein kinase